MNTGYRCPRFAELDRLIAEEDEREHNALKGKEYNPHVTGSMALGYKRESEKWAAKRALRATCPHEHWNLFGTLQLMCTACGKTKQREPKR